MAGKPAEAEDPKKGVIKSGEFKGEEVVYKPNGDVLFVGNDSAGGTSNDPGTTYRKRLDGSYGSNRGILDIGPVEEEKEVAYSGGGGGGGGGGGKPSPGPGPQKPVTIVDEYETIIPGSEGILGGYDNMVNWEPISSNGNGGAGLNPLVDPDEWMVQLPELNMGKQTRQWVPNKRFHGGLI